jgi:hypothetical protein
MGGDAAYRRRHAVLAHAVVDVATGKIATADVLLVLLGFGVIRRCQVRGAADELGERHASSCRARCRGLPRRDLRVRLSEIIAEFSDGTVETGRMLAPLPPQEFGAAFHGKRLQAGFPGAADVGATLAGGLPLSANVLGNDEGWVVPAEPFARPRRSRPHRARRCRPWSGTGRRIRPQNGAWPAPCRRRSASPWPIGPVVTSMPLAWPRYGYPAVRLPSWRKRFSSSIVMSG